MPLEPVLQDSLNKLRDVLNRATQRKWYVGYKTCNLDIQLIATSGWYRLQSSSLDVWRDLPLSDQFVAEFAEHCKRHMAAVPEHIARDVRMNHHGA